MRAPYCPHDDIHREAPHYDYEVWVLEPGEEAWCAVPCETKEEAELCLTYEANAARRLPEAFPDGVTFELREFGKTTERIKCEGRKAKCELV